MKCSGEAYSFRPDFFSRYVFSIEEIVSGSNLLVYGRYPGLSVSYAMKMRGGQKNSQYPGWVWLLDGKVVALPLYLLEDKGGNRLIRWIVWMDAVRGLVAFLTADVFDIEAGSLDPSLEQVLLKGIKIGLSDELTPRPAPETKPPYGIESSETSEVLEDNDVVGVSGTQSQCMGERVAYFFV